MPPIDRSSAVPTGLRRWFVIHFIIDVIFAIPLLLAPGMTLALFGWQSIDPATTRLVGAALMGIGVESWLARNSGVETFKGMLNLKLIWSSSAVLAIALSLYEGAPPMAWSFLLIFGLFFGIWLYYRLLMKPLKQS